METFRADLLQAEREEQEESEEKINQEDVSGMKW